MVSNVGLNFLVKRGGRIVESLMCQPRLKMPINFQGIKYAPALEKDTVQIDNILLSKIRQLREGDFQKAMTDSSWMPEMPIFKLSDAELLSAMKNKDYKTIQKRFSFEVIHLDGLQSYLKQKGYEGGFSEIDRNISNKLYNEFVEYERLLYRTFDEFLFPVSKNKKCFDIEQKLSSMGISVRLTEHENMADDIYRACLKMKEAGIKDIPNIRVEANRTTPCGMGLCDKKVKDGYVFIGTMRDQIWKIGVSDTVEGMVYHETAHCLNNHFQVSDMAPCFAKQDEYFQSVKDILKKYVSIYSAENPSEAGAEMFCGWMLGNKYPKEITDIAEHYKCVKPNN